MAILHIEEAGGGIRRWAVWVAIAMVIGFAFALIYTGSGPLLRVDPSMPAHPPDETASSPGPRQTAASVVVAAGPPSAGRIAHSNQPAHASPAQLQTQARLYADCQAMDARRVQGVMSELDESYAVDPSGALASAYRDDELRRLERCRHVGTAEYRQIEPLMQEAARRGEPNARFFLVEQSLRRLIERAAEARAQGETDTSAEAARTAQAVASVRELERMALQGWRPAMQSLAGGLLTSDELLPADPLRAAAWNLVASRQPDDDAPLTMDDLHASGQLTPLTAEDGAQVVAKAQQLREACCRRLR